MWRHHRAAQTLVRTPEGQHGARIMRPSGPGTADSLGRPWQQQLC